jgi:dephospho-CoA kinase
MYTMKVLGLTGGIGMGKSTCASLLRARHIPVIDTDELARSIVEPGQPALAEVAAAFGPQILTSGGRLDRSALARIVFADPVARQLLEAILHPRIRALWQDQVHVWRTEGRSLAFVVIPLLFETGAQAEVDFTLCVACLPATQRERLAVRGWSASEVERRNRAQLPVEQKVARSHYVIWSEGSLEVHAAQLDLLLARLR